MVKKKPPGPKRERDGYETEQDSTLEKDNFDSKIAVVMPMRVATSIRIEY